MMTTSDFSLRLIWIPIHRHEGHPVAAMKLEGEQGRPHYGR
jgi:hypothetical protein